MKHLGPVVLQSSHLVEGSCSAGRGRGRRFLDVVECAYHVYDRSERVVRLVLGGSERLRAVVVEVPWRGRPGVNLVSRCRGLRFRRIGRNLLRLVVAVRRFREHGVIANCDGGILEDYLLLSGAPCVVASVVSKTIEGRPQRPMSRSPKGRERAGVCFARVEALPAFGMHCETWERSCDRWAAKARIPAAAERSGADPRRVGQGRTESCGVRSALRARAVEARDGKGPPGQAVLRSLAVVEPMTASGH